MDLATARAAVQALLPQARADLAALVAIPSVADPRQYPAEECARAARWVRDAFHAAGITDIDLHETPDGSMAVVGSAEAPPGTPTVLLYCHYDVQPPLDDDAWETPPFELTERDGRLYGRGAADCKGNIVTHLTALRALGALGADDAGDGGGAGGFPVGIKVVAEGSEEQGTGGLESFVPAHPDLLRADAILVCDTGNAAVGVPAVTSSLRGLANVVVTVETLDSEIHSGMFGGPAPDALAALIHMLASLRDSDGNTTITGLDNAQTWAGVGYPADQFRTDAHVLDGVDLAGDPVGDVADLVWARPAVTVLGIDCPPVVGSAAAILPKAAARLNLRVPPGTDARLAQDLLVAHLEAAAPWHARVTIEREADGEPFRARTDGPAYDALATAMTAVYGTPLGHVGQGGSIPLCNVFATTYPDAEIVLMGVEEPQCLIHAPNESVDPSEIENMALVETLFLRSYGGAGQHAAESA